MAPSFEVTVPPLRSGAKIGSLDTNFQAFCFILFQYTPNCLSGWKILFDFRVTESPHSREKGFTKVFPRFSAGCQRQFPSGHRQGILRTVRERIPPVRVKRNFCPAGGYPKAGECCSRKDGS